MLQSINLRWKKNMTNRTQVCNVKIWTEEPLALLKMRGVITENMLSLKSQKHATTGALNGEDVLMLLPTASGISWIYQVLPFVVTRDTSPIGNKISDREFYWSAAREFYFWLWIWNCKSPWFVDKYIRKLMLKRKYKSYLEK